MRKIRIGNDIRLAVDLRLYIGGNRLREREVYDPEATDFENLDTNPYVNKDTEVYSPNQYSSSETEVSTTTLKNGVGIRSVKAFLINTSIDEERTAYIKKKSRFITRFPIEPYLDCFTANPYNVCNSGYPTWRAYPHAHVAMPYHGYGVMPQWGGIYKKLPIDNSCEFLAPVIATDKQNVIEVSFPAEAQRFTGKYKLIIVAKVYAPGFNLNNLKTVTIDMPDVFELVKTSEEGIDTGIDMTVNHIDDVLTNISDSEDVHYNDVYVDSGSYDNDVVTLTRTDGLTVNVDLGGLTAWYEGD